MFAYNSKCCYITRARWSSVQMYKIHLFGVPAVPGCKRRQSFKLIFLRFTAVCVCAWIMYQTAQKNAVTAEKTLLLLLFCSLIML